MGNRTWVRGPSSPIFGEDGTIYFILTDRKSYHLGHSSTAVALSEDGKEKWRKELLGVGITNPFINEDKNLVIPTVVSGNLGVQYTLTLDGKNSIEELTNFRTSLFYSNGVKYHTDRTINYENEIEYTLRATNQTKKDIWNYSIETDRLYIPRDIDHVTNAGVVYLTTYYSRNYDQFVSSIFKGTFNWTTSGIPLYYENEVYVLNLLEDSSNPNNSTTTISKLDIQSGKAKDTEVLNFNPTSEVAFDNDVILFAVGKNIHKVTFDKTTKTGWVKKSGKWLFYDTKGVPKTGWYQEDGKWYYLNPVGVMKTEWYEVNEKWYYSSSSGVMQTGWIKDKNKWYFISSNGDMKNGWLKLNNKWYFLDNSGAMESGWFKDKGTWHYASSDGAMQTGWVKVNNLWYFLDTNGAMKTNWLQQGDKWCFLDPYGAMITEWKYVNNKWYYFYPNGQMATNTTINGYKVDKNGAWIQ